MKELITFAIFQGSQLLLMLAGFAFLIIIQEYALAIIPAIGYVSGLVLKIWDATGYEEMEE